MQISLVEKLLWKLERFGLVILILEARDKMFIGKRSYLDLWIEHPIAYNSIAESPVVHFMRPRIVLNH